MWTGRASRQHIHSSSRPEARATERPRFWLRFALSSPTTNCTASSDNPARHFSKHIISQPSPTHREARRLSIANHTIPTQFRSHTTWTPIRSDNDSAHHESSRYGGTEPALPSSRPRLQCMHTAVRRPVNTRKPLPLPVVRVSPPAASRFDPSIATARATICTTELCDERTSRRRARSWPPC